MKRVVFCIILLVLAYPLFAQTVKLWRDYDVDRKMRYSEITVFRADQQKNSGIGVIVCPGGSYCYLGMQREGYDVAKWLNNSGITTFVLRYRVGMHANHHPAMIQDLQRTIQIVREHSAEYGVDPKKIGVMGFSAGGHLAGTAGVYYMENFLEPLGIHPTVSLRPDFIAMVYPVVSMEDSIAHRKSRYNLLGRQHSQDLVQKMSLEKNVHTGMPPVFLMHCRDDRTVDVRNSMALAKAMEKKGLIYKEMLYQTGDHGFGVSPGQRADARMWTAAFEEWVKELRFENYSLMNNNNSNQ